MKPDDQQLELLGALKALGGSAGNGRLRELLGWDEGTYEVVKAPLIAAGHLITGRGRGGSVSLAGESQGERSEVIDASTSEETSPRATQSRPPAPPEPGIQPSGKQNLSAFFWSVADLLRGDYKQSDYGKVILPFTVLRRLDCVLEPTKDAVLCLTTIR
jgi:type I restriction enzyme M protein